MKLESSIVLDFVTHSPITGEVTDATSTTVEVFENDTDTPIITPTATKRTGKTGNYRVQIDATAANGFEVGKSYNVIVTALVGPRTGKAVISTLQIEATNIDDKPSAAQAADAVWDEARAGHIGAGTFGEGIASVQGNVTGNVLGSVDSVVDPVTVGTNNDKTGYALTGADKDDIVDRVWDEPRSGHTTVGTFGEGLNDLTVGFVTHKGTATGSTVASITLDAGASAVSNFYNGQLIVITSGTGVRQVRVISDYDGPSRIAVINPSWQVQPIAGSTFTIISGQHAIVDADGFVQADVQQWLNVTPNALISGRVDANVGVISSAAEDSLVDKVWDEPKAGHSIADTFGDYLDSKVSTAGLDAQEVADAVWDEPMAGHTVTDSFGEFLRTRVIHSGTLAGAISGSSLQLDGAANTTNNYYIGKLLCIIGGTGAGQSRVIAAHIGSNAIVFRPFVVVPDNTSRFLIVSEDLPPTALNGTLNAGGSVVNTIDAPVLEDIADRVWDEARADHTAPGSFGEGVSSVQGNVTGSVDSVVDPVTVGTNNDKTGYELTNAQHDAIVDKVWDELQINHNTSGTFGANLDVPVSTVAVGGITLPDIAAAVWDETAISHTAVGSTGLLLNQISANTQQVAIDVPTALAIVETLLKYQANRTKIDKTAFTLTVYDDNGITPIKVFDLKNSSGQPSVTEITERVPQ